MSWRWAAEVRAVARKEWRTERRARHGLWTAGLFSLTAVAAMAFAAFGERPAPNLAAGMLAVVLLFSAVTAVPRTFLIEDEQGTLDLLRLLGRPETTFLGKFAAVLAQLAVQAAALSVVFVVLVDRPVVLPAVFGAGLAAYVFALASIVSLAGALAAGAANRWLLAGAVAMPLLLPTVAMAVGALRVGLGAGFAEGGWINVAALAGFGLCAAGTAPWLVRGLWTREP